MRPTPVGKTPYTILGMKKRVSRKLSHSFRKLFDSFLIILSMLNRLRRWQDESLTQRAHQTYFKIIPAPISLVGGTNRDYFKSSS